jgi:diadenosine tetraphosphate (Ap4A) HIT family hydrolase
MPLIEERVAAARAGINPKVLCRMRSGWAVIGDVQFLPGYCLLLSDPVVPGLNDLPEQKRLTFLSDMARIGDAILSVTRASRINYEILGNSEPELHAHIFPRYADEPDENRRMPVWFYDWKNAPRFSAEQHGELFALLRTALEMAATPHGDEIALRRREVQ